MSELGEKNNCLHYLVFRIFLIKSICSLHNVCLATSYTKKKHRYAQKLFLNNPSLSNQKHKIYKFVHLSHLLICSTYKSPLHTHIQGKYFISISSLSYFYPINDCILSADAKTGINRDGHTRSWVLNVEFPYIFWYFSI